MGPRPGSRRGSPNARGAPTAPQRQHSSLVPFGAREPVRGPPARPGRLRPHSTARGPLRRPRPIRPRWLLPVLRIPVVFEFVLEAVPPTAPASLTVRFAQCARRSRSVPSVGFGRCSGEGRSVRTRDRAAPPDRPMPVVILRAATARVPCRRYPILWALLTTAPRKNEKRGGPRILLSPSGSGGSALRRSRWRPKRGHYACQCRVRAARVSSTLRTR